jgi:hypothetical protein
MLVMGYGEKLRIRPQGTRAQAELPTHPVKFGFTSQRFQSVVSESDYEKLRDYLGARGLQPTFYA